MGIGWMEKKTNEEVLRMVNEKRTILNTIENRRGKMIGHLMRHDNYFRTILEGKIKGKRGRGQKSETFIG